MLRYYNSPFKIVWEVCFDKCSKGALAEDEIKLRADGTTNLKLEALPKIVSFVQFSKMTVTYSGDRPKLSVDRFAGTVNYSLGFTLDGEEISNNMIEHLENGNLAAVGQDLKDIQKALGDIYRESFFE